MKLGEALKVAKTFNSKVVIVDVYGSMYADNMK